MPPFDATLCPSHRAHTVTRSSSPAATWLSITIGGFVMISALSICMKTLNTPAGTYPGNLSDGSFFILDQIFNWLFSVEFFVRLYAEGDCSEFFNDYMNLVDVFALMPFFIEVFFLIKSAGDGGEASSEGAMETAYVNMTMFPNYTAPDLNVDRGALAALEAMQKTKEQLIRLLTVLRMLRILKVTR